MQTFLPYPSFEASARCLDWRRLGKQRAEAYQILQTLQGTSSGWRNHPAVRMWEGYASALALYGVVVCVEWRRRGYQDSLLQKLERLVQPDAALVMPPWLGDKAFHASHRSNLLRKDQNHYGRFGWREEPNLPYVWPVNSGKGEVDHV